MDTGEKAAVEIRHTLGRGRFAATPGACRVRSGPTSSFATTGWARKLTSKTSCDELVERFVQSAGGTHVVANDKGGPHG